MKIGALYAILLADIGGEITISRHIPRTSIYC